MIRLTAFLILILAGVSYATPGMDATEGAANQALAAISAPENVLITLTNDYSQAIRARPRQAFTPMSSMTLKASTEDSSSFDDCVKWMTKTIDQTKASAGAKGEVGGTGGGMDASGETMRHREASGEVRKAGSKAHKAALETTLSFAPLVNWKEVESNAMEVVAVGQTAKWILTPNMYTIDLEVVIPGGCYANQNDADMREDRKESIATEEDCIRDKLLHLNNRHNVWVKALHPTQTMPVRGHTDFTLGLDGIVKQTSESEVEMRAEVARRERAAAAPRLRAEAEADSTVRMAQHQRGGAWQVAQCVTGVGAFTGCAAATSIADCNTQTTAAHAANTGDTCVWMLDGPNMEMLKKHSLGAVAPMFRSQNMNDQSRWYTIKDNADLQNRIGATPLRSGGLPGCIDPASDRNAALILKAEDQENWWLMIAEIEFAKDSHQDLKADMAVRFRDIGETMQMRKPIRSWKGNQGMVSSQTEWGYGKVYRSSRFTNGIDPTYGPLIVRDVSVAGQPDVFRLGFFTTTQLSEFQSPHTIWNNGGKVKNGNFKMQFSDGEYARNRGRRGTRTRGGGHGYIAYTNDANRAFEMEFRHYTDCRKDEFYIECATYDMKIDYSRGSGCIGIHDQRHRGQKFEIKPCPRYDGYYTLEAVGDNDRNGQFVGAYDNSKKDGDLYLSADEGWANSFRFEKI